MIFLFSDFGVGPYIGQVEARLYAEGVAGPIIRLMDDAPRFDAHASGLLLEALVHELPAECAVLAVVDPGVGSARRPLWVTVGGRQFIGPDNGLFAPMLRSASNHRVRRIDWQPQRISSTFHGRDLFAPALARVAMGRELGSTALELTSLVGISDAPRRQQVIYVDGFGNLWTGIRASEVPVSAIIVVGALKLSNVRTYSDRAVGSAFWYQNSSGLVEIAVNQGSAASMLNAVVGTAVEPIF